MKVRINSRAEFMLVDTALKMAITFAVMVSGKKRAYRTLQTVYSRNLRGDEDQVMMAKILRVRMENLWRSLDPKDRVEVRPLP